ncbi:hypothetical protein [Actibacterium sp. 188UL27-1]|uniref:hypothetical protein n=1 Tax=Actibacterium sp. 188UL27-1 TaxID=2786961 RepID=UPI001959C0C1|nr:hypothetical protein [Actibacterium sp. 188UL27-1]MBM7067179.1 hypothetical protein [Actibacterium sp. 188UL27-1]
MKNTATIVNALILALIIVGWTTDASLAKDPPYKFRPPPEPDPTAAYCDRRAIGYPHGKIVPLGERVFHTCANSVDTALLAVSNVRRLPGLQYYLTEYSTMVRALKNPIDGLSQYETVLERSRDRYTDFRNNVTLSQANYRVYHDKSRLLPVDGKSGRKVHPGNLRVYNGPVDNLAEITPHFVKCTNEPFNIALNDDYHCYVYVSWHGLYARVNIWAGGDRFTPMEHKHFPAIAEDVLILLRAIDVTDDNARQACIRAGRGWWDGICKDG